VAGIIGGGKLGFLDIDSTLYNVEGSAVCLKSDESKIVGIRSP